MPDAVNPRLRKALPILAAVAVVGVAVTIPLWTSSRGAGRSASGSSASELSSVEPAAPVTAAALAHYHWSELPSAPITPRAQPATVWTGKQMLVWGGEAPSARDDTVYGNGAAYDPSTKTWTALPKAPIDARGAMGSVWTGSQLFVFGGYDSVNDEGIPHALADGALYSPKTHTWQRLPAAPLAARLRSQVVWTGHEVVVLGGDPADQSLDKPGYVRGTAAYDPTTKQWRLLPTMPTVSGHEVRHLKAVMTPKGIYVWQFWQHITTTSDGGELISGIDLAIYHPLTNTWTADPAAAGGLGQQQAPWGIDQLVVGGGTLYVPAVQPWRGDGSMAPPSFNLQGAELDLTTNTWSRTPRGPLDDVGALGIWTGAALLEYDAMMEMHTDDGPTIGPGETAAFDPATATWTSLPTAPEDDGADGIVWAGTQLLAWGTNGLSFGP
jgi:hypothetical protein